MGLFGPDTDAINRKYNNSVNSATDQFVGSMLPHINSSKGLVDTNGNLTWGANQTSAQLPNQQVDFDVAEYLDPSLNFQMQRANDQIANQYGGKGSLFSGAAGNAIANNTQQMAQTGYSQAWDRAMADNNRINSLGQQQFNNQMGIDQFNNAANAANFGQQFGINNQNFSNANDVYGTRLGSKVNAAGTTAATAMSQKSPFDYAMDITKLGTGIGAAIGGLG